MAVIHLLWDPPATRTSGRPLKPGDIAGYTCEQSLDGGKFAKLPDVAPDVTTLDVEAAEPGIYHFRVACFDKRNETGDFASGSIEVEDTTPPGAVLNLRLSVDVEVDLVMQQG